MKVHFTVVLFSNHSLLFGSTASSGSTVGISSASTAAVTNDQANNGAQSLQVVLKDNAGSSSNWSVRLLSGGGARASNLQFANAGYLGFWMKTTTAPSGAQVAVVVDDQRNGAADKTELSSQQTAINDGQWHLYQWQLPGSGWTSYANGNGVLDSTMLSLDAIMLFAPNNSPDWTVWIDDVSENSASVLPVELESFTGSSTRSVVQLNWRTATEQNNYGFDVERKNASLPLSLQAGAGNGGWAKVGFVEGSGTTNAPRTYAFADAVSQAGQYSYRLRQIDRSGAFRYSSEITMNVGSAPASFALEQNFPNPFNPATTIRFAIPDRAKNTIATLKIYDMLGREVATLMNELKEAGFYSVQWNTSARSSGAYYYTLKAGGFSETKKMILQK